MCVVICANLKVSQWRDFPLPEFSRASLQICPIIYDRTPGQAVESIELDEAAQRREMKRSAWLQAYYRYRAREADHGVYRAELRVLSTEWKNALEAIAKTWGRLLHLVRLRW